MNNKINGNRNDKISDTEIMEPKDGNRKEDFITSKITQEELDAIKFYMGDPEIVAKGLYAGGPKAYNTINALLHKGTLNEQEKIQEGRTIWIENTEHLKSYLKLIVRIVTAMEKYRKQHLNHEADTSRNMSLTDNQSEQSKKRMKSACSDSISYRIDRFSAIKGLQTSDKTAGFFSTCKYGFLPEYAHIKANIALMEIHRDVSVPYLDFSELLKEFYAKPEEAEVLFPFDARISELEQVELSEEEKRIYTDINGNPPCGKWRFRLSAGQWASCSQKELEELYETVTSEETVKKVQHCMSVMAEKRELSEAENAFYGEWKDQLYRYLSGTLAKLN